MDCTDVVELIHCSNLEQKEGHSIRWPTFIAVMILMTTSATLATSATIPESVSQLLKPAGVFDGIDGGVKAGWQVLVTTDKIVAVGPNLAAPTNARYDRGAQLSVPAYL